VKYVSTVNTSPTYRTYRGAMTVLLKTTVRTLLVRRWRGRRDKARLEDRCAPAAAGRGLEGDQGRLPAVA